MVKNGILFSVILLSGVSAHAATVICHSGSCRPITDYEPGQISSQLEEMFYKGARELLFCESDAATKKCQKKPISFPARTNLAYIDFQIPFARVSQIRNDGMNLKMVMDYQVKANQYYPACSGSDSSLILGTNWGGSIQLVSPLFKCRVTEMGATQVSLRFDLDYVDLDAGRFGGTYRVAVRGDVLGNGSGYALLQLTEERAIKQERPLPTDPLTSDRTIGGSSDRGSGQLFDWDWDNIKVKWNAFKEKFLKILYLEPIE